MASAWGARRLADGGRQGNRLELSTMRRLPLHHRRCTRNLPVVQADTKVSADTWALLQVGSGQCLCNPIGRQVKIQHYRIIRRPISIVLQKLILLYHRTEELTSVLQRPASAPLITWA